MTTAPWSVDPLTITLLGGMIVTVIGALVTGIVSIITAVHMTAVRAQQAVNTASLLTVAKDAEAIKGHVNSEKTAADGREATLQRENALLREMIADKTRSAQLLAQATAQALPTEPPRLT